VLYITRAVTTSTEYTIKNKSTDARAMILEHPLNAQEELLEPKGFEEKTASHYRFRVPLEAENTRKFTVRVKQPTVQTVAIVSDPLATLLTYTSTDRIDKSVREALAKAVALRQELADLQARQAAINKELQEISTGQERLRQNINTTGRDTALGKRYVEKLSAEEDRIDALRTELSQLQPKIEAKQAELANFISELNVEPSR
jgi:hypothetical protein